MGPDDLCEKLHVTPCQPVDRSVSLVLDSSALIQLSPWKSSSEFSKTEEEVGELKKLESELAKSLEGKRSYMESLHENEMALKEFQLLEDDTNVFKMIGPVLVKQDAKEALENVKRRLEYYKE